MDILPGTVMMIMMKYYFVAQLFGANDTMDDTNWSVILVQIVMSTGGSFVLSDTVHVRHPMDPIER